MKVLSSLYFSDVLALVTLGVALVLLVDRFFLAPRRNFLLFSAQATRGGKRSREEMGQSALVGFCQEVFPLLFIIFLLRTFFIDHFRIPSASMRPSLLEGDFILVQKYAYGFHIPLLEKQVNPFESIPARGDVVVFRHRERNQDMIKRVIGLPGDRIIYRNKRLFINGQEVEDKQAEEFYEGTDIVRQLSEVQGEHQFSIYQTLKGGESSSGAYVDVLVPDNSYFVLGDNRDNSNDSRVWGFVEHRNLMGKAFMVWASLDFKAWTDWSFRRDRTFKNID